MAINVKAHTSIIGDTGYNCHSRNLFKALNKITPVSVRNWSVGDTWKGYSDEPHNDEYYMDSELKTMLSEQTLYTKAGPVNWQIYSNYKGPNAHDVNIVLNDNKHPYFFENYNGPKIAYNVWETTEQPAQFFEALTKFDQVWVPSEWQKEHTVKQGIPEYKVKVVPEGVDTEVYKPINTSTKKAKDRPFRFIVIGRWEYRKSTREIIQAFITEFSNGENVELLLNVDNRFASDGLSTTEERLEKFGISDPRIKVLHHLSKEEYVKTLQSCDVFVSCSRSEGWNLPLIEAMASGIPSIYSEYGAQLQFAKDKGLPVKIVGEILAAVDNDESWDKNAPGKFAEPDFTDLAKQLRYSYKNFEAHKKKALADSEIVRTQFTWENAANIAYRHIQELIEPAMIESLDDFAWVTCGNAAYMPVIEMLVKSLNSFSNRKIIVYGIDCEVTFTSPNLIARTLTIPQHSEFDKWYWKQYACIESLNEGFENYVWLDGDIVANYNIDSIVKYFPELENYPIPDKHVQEDFFAVYRKPNNPELKSQLFNETLNKKYGFPRLETKSHVCMYIYNKECKWWFDEILEIYKETDLADYSELLQWNDEGIDNLLRSKYQAVKFLPVSNFDVSAWDGTLMRKNEKAMEHFISFWRDKGPKNFGNIYGWQFIPKDKSNILYFHGNKNIEFAEFMLDYIKLQKSGKFYDSKYFFVGKNEVKNLGSIEGEHGGTLDIANKYGWDYAIFHEIYNLKDYEHPREGNPIVKVWPGDVVVDLGGNLGIFTRYAYHMGASKIITFEPDSRYFEILKQNSPSNVVLFNAAISNSIGELTLTESEHLGGSNLWHKPDALQTQYTVNTYTLDYLFETGLVDRIDFLKVDIEGSEILALQGISDANLAKVRNIAVEYHHEHLKFDTQLRDSFIHRLNRLGFNSHVLFCGYNDALQLIYFWK